jgi:hypothetical protein
MCSDVIKRDVVIIHADLNEGLILAQRGMVLILIEQGQLIDDHGIQREQLQLLQAFDRHVHPLLKGVLEQPVKQLKGLRPQFKVRGHSRLPAA